MSGELNENWQQTLDNFNRVMESLALKWTLKLHFQPAHTSDFLVRYALDASFAAFTEQAMESKHRTFRSFSHRFNVPHEFQ